MARNRIHIAAPPERVFAALSDPQRYPDWVVGSAAIERQDPDFPAPGTRFHHRVGMRPLALADYTEAVAVEPPRRLALKAKARPLGTADITLELTARAGGTEVLMVEEPGDRLSALLAGNRVADLALRLRNAEALSRLKRSVEGRPLGPPRRRRELAGQRVLITGGSSGIGLAVAEQLAAEGAHVALLARNPTGLQNAQHRIAPTTQRPTGRFREHASRNRPIGVVTLVADVRAREALAAAVAEAAQRHGGLDVLVTAAAAASFGSYAE
ncbi:MAG: SDR family NAD(P)-dependent oxidoreductase, partial [Solirubrobacterales bacterium]